MATRRTRRIALFATLVVPRAAGAQPRRDPDAAAPTRNLVAFQGGGNWRYGTIGFAYERRMVPFSSVGLEAAWFPAPRGLAYLPTGDVAIVTRLWPWRREAGPHAGARLGVAVAGWVHDRRQSVAAIVAGEGSPARSDAAARRERGMGLLKWIAAAWVGLGSAGCEELPALDRETERLRVGAEVSLCAGTLADGGSVGAGAPARGRCVTGPRVLSTRV